MTQVGIDLVCGETDPSATYQWINCPGGGWVSGATSQSFSPLTNGSYAVRVTANGCMLVSDCFDVLTVGLQGKDGQAALSIYPNPANERLIILIELHNSNGVLVLVEQTW